MGFYNFGEFSNSIYEAHMADDVPKPSIVLIDEPNSDFLNLIRKQKLEINEGSADFFHFFLPSSDTDVSAAINEAKSVSGESWISLPYLIGIEHDGSKAHFGTIETDLEKLLALLQTMRRIMETGSERSIERLRSTYKFRSTSAKAKAWASSLFKAYKNVRP